MTKEKEMTAPDTSVSADEGQPLNQAESSIADGEEDYSVLSVIILYISCCEIRQYIFSLSGFNPLFNQFRQG